MTLRFKKWVLRPLLILAIALVAVVGAAILVLFTQQHRLVNLAVGKVNEQIHGEVTIQNSSISLFKNFPYVSIALHDGRLFGDKTKKTNPIYTFERLYVGFSLPDILQQKYNVRRLFLRGGQLALVQEADGKLNLMEAIATPVDTLQPQPADTAGFEMDLQKLMFKNIDVSFLDQASGRMLRSKIDKLSSSFKIDREQVTIALTSGMEWDLTTPTDTTLFRHKRFYLDIEAAYKKETKRLEISSGLFKLQEAAFTVVGSADLADQAKVDFRIQGDKPDFNLMAAFLPGDVKTTLKPFQYDGRIYFDGTIKGDVSNGQLPLIQVSFGCQDAWFLNTGAGKKVDQLGFKGFYTNGSEHSLHTSELHITNMSARPEKGIFKGNFIMRDFTDPHTLVQINSELELKFLGEFLGIPGLQQLTGKIKLDMDFKDLTGVELPEQSLNKLKEGIQSKLIVEDLSFRIPGYPHRVQHMNLQAEMKDGKITLDSTSLRIGDSDLRLAGSISDVHAFLHDREKPVTLTLQASSKKLVLKELFEYDTALSRKMTDEIHGFNVGVSLETTVQQLLHPEPLPKGKFEMKNLRASFKQYPHTFQDLGTTAVINDTALWLRNFTGMIDQSDFKFSGRVKNYQLWFNKVMIGRTQVAFDFKSNHFVIKDVLGPMSRKYMPRGYRREEANDVWLRAKVDLKYDTVFKFANAKISNITGSLKNHNLKLKDIKGNVKYGARVLIIDTLKGTIGRSDFDINLRMFAGKDRQMRKRTNSLQFRSVFLDADEISAYDLAPPTGRRRTPKGVKPDSAVVVVKPDSSAHAKAFNIFTIPFSDFNMQVDIGKLKYNKLWLKDVKARVRMQEDHHLFIDTLAMKVADGKLNLRGHLNGSDTSKIYFKSVINVEQVDLEKMMLKLDHFGQDVVINKNIKGRLTGQIKSYVQVHPNLVPIMSNTKADLNISVYNGALVDFAPMQAMAGYFKDKNLRLIRFDTLQNRFSFSNGELNIPSMDINSSLGYIQLSGKQSLDLSMEYYVRVPMKMVTKVGLQTLFDKKTGEVDINQVDEIDYSEKDKKIRFMNLKITGTPEDFKVGLGKDKDKTRG